MKKDIDWKQVDELNDEKSKQHKLDEAQIAIMRDALIQALYALEWLKNNPGEWNDLADRALTSVNWVLSSDAGHEFLDSYVRMQKALVALKANQILGNLELPDDNRDLH